MSQQINLVNPAFRKQREWFAALMLIQALAALIVIVLIFYGYQYRQVLLLEKQNKAGADALALEQARLVKVAAEHAPRQKNPALQAQVDEMEQQLKGEEAVLEVLQSGALGNTQGYSGYMRAFARQTVNGLWLTGFSIKGAGKEMRLGGRTLRPDLVPAYILRLNQEVATQGRSFAALEMQRPKLEPAAKDQPQKIPNYLEFILHSNSAEDAK
ncbi:MAG: fimbrial assembly protein [Sulfuricella denitrificans]|nr:fimbrial assembly protein [Sulfuricella denitrificans]